ncbi:MAG: hypothetical protein J6B96_09360 [Agathobacter sp.]|nr:hypothetical protein [Agathobacter sp.]
MLENKGNNKRGSFASKCILFMALLIFVIIICVWYNKTHYFQNNYMTYFDKYNVIHENQLSSISNGMTYDEVIRKVGKANRVVGSGFLIFEYKCWDGKVVHLTFEGYGDIEDETLRLIHIGQPHYLEE